MKRQSFTLRVPPDLHNRAEALAKSRGTSLNTLITEAMRTFIEANQPQLTLYAGIDYGSAPAVSVVTVMGVEPDGTMHMLGSGRITARANEDDVIRAIMRGAQMNGQPVTKIKEKLTWVEEQKRKSSQKSKGVSPSSSAGSSRKQMVKHQPSTILATQRVKSSPSHSHGRKSRS